MPETARATDDTLPPMLGSALPPPQIEQAMMPLMRTLQRVLDEEIAPRAAENDAIGRYPVETIACLKRTGILAASLPPALGGMGMSNRMAVEVQTRMAVADSAVAQIYKVHDEMVREIPGYCPQDLLPRLAEAICREQMIIGLAVAEPGRKVDDPMRTLAQPQPGGGYVIEGEKIYTTGAAEADLLAVWAFDPTDPAIAGNPLNGLRLNLLPKGTPGVDIRRDWDALGQRATDSGSIGFSGVRTDPAWAGNVPGRFPPVHASLRYQVGFCALLVGLGIGALREAMAFVPAKSRPWPSAGVENAAEDLIVQRMMGSLAGPLAAAHMLNLEAGTLLDRFEAGDIDRTALAIPVYAAKIAATRASLAATSEAYTMMGARAAARGNGFDRYWRNARILALHDPVGWKEAEIGRHLLTGWQPEPGIYQ